MWVFSRLFVNSGQKDLAKFLNFDPCTVYGKKVRVSKGFFYLLFGPHPLVQYYSVALKAGNKIPSVKKNMNF